MKSPGILALLAALLLAIGAGVFLFLGAGEDGPEGVPALGLGPGGAPAALTPESAATAQLTAADSNDADLEQAGIVEASGSGRRSSSGRWRAPRTAVWLDGRVSMPDGAPVDEQMTVRAEGREFVNDADGRDWHLSKVESDGTFRVALAAGSRIGRLTLQGRYTYLDKPKIADVADIEGGEELVLAAKLGGRVLVEVLPPRSVAFNQEALAGLSVQARQGQNPWDVAGSIDGRRINDATFEVGGLEAGRAYVIRAIHPNLANGEISDVKVEPGETKTVQVPLSVGALITGKVVNLEGEPIAGAEVVPITPQEAQWRNPFMNLTQAAPVTTASDGSFELPGVTPGEKILVIEAEGYLEYKNELGELGEATERRDMRILLDRGGVVSGMVKWPGGEPAAGVEVRVSQGELLFGMRDMERLQDSLATQEDGSFTVTGLGSSGTVTVTASAVERGWTIPEDATLRERKFGVQPPIWRAHADDVVVGNRKLVLELVPGSAIAGQVVNDVGEPVKSFQVIATPADQEMLSTLSIRPVKERFKDKDGEFSLGGLVAGRWRVRARAVGYGECTEREISVPYSGELRFELPRSGGITGRVLNPEGDALGDARVTAEHGAGRTANANVDADGTFSLGRLEPGPVTLTATSDEFASSEPYVVNVGADALREDVVLTLRMGATITGEVHASQGEVADRQITLSGGGWNREETDSEGRFEFTGLEPGEYEVQLGAAQGQGRSQRGRNRWMAASVRTKSVKVTVAAGAREHVVLGEPSGNAVAVSGMVTDNGEPVAGGLVTVFAMEDAGDALAMAELEDDGSYSLIVDEGPGSYRFMVGKGWGAQSPFEVELSGSEQRLDFEMPGGSLRGTVYDAAGSPLEGASLTLSLESDANASGRSSFSRRRTAQTKADGSYEFDDMAAGTYLLRAGGPNSRTDLARLVVRDVAHDGESQDRRDIELPLGGEVTGTVLDSAGGPVRNANLRYEDEQGARLIEWSRSRTNRSGEFSQGGLPPGDVWVYASSDGRRSERVRVRVSSGGTASAQLVLPAE